MKEKEVNEKFLVSNLKPVMAPDERKHAAHFQEEGLQLCQNRRLQLPLAVLIGVFQEIERALVPHRLLRLIANMLW